MDSSGACSVYVVDDDADVREAIAALLATADLPTRLFATPEAFLRATPPDVHGCLILDVSLPGMDGLELQRHLRSVGFQIPIIFLTAFGDIPMSVAAMKSGAAEFFTKPFDEEALIAAVELALARDRALHDKSAERAALRQRYETLSPRERQVMTLVARGLRNKEIAAELGTREITVKVHRGRVMHKMRADSLADLVRMEEKIRLSR